MGSSDRVKIPCAILNQYDEKPKYFVTKVENEKFKRGKAVIGSYRDTYLINIIY